MAACLGVVVVAAEEESLVVVVVAVAVEASLTCPEASLALGSACPCNSVSLQLLHLEPLRGLRAVAEEQTEYLSLLNVP